MTEHAPNTPRTHNTKGQRVNEPAQCIYDLQQWPCEVEVLRREIVRLSEENADLRERVHELLDRDEPEGIDDENLRTWKEETDV